jgi:hypothetical protein
LSLKLQSGGWNGDGKKAAKNASKVLRGEIKKKPAQSAAGSALSQVAEKKKTKKSAAKKK